MNVYIPETSFEIPFWVLLVVGIPLAILAYFWIGIRVGRRVKKSCQKWGAYTPAEVNSNAISAAFFLAFCNFHYIDFQFSIEADFQIYYLSCLLSFKLFCWKSD